MPAPAPEQTGAATGCDMTVYNNPNFAGDSESVTQGESELNDAWDKKIASIQVKAGIWDVFAEAEYGGESMRLTPGNYNSLGDQWSGKISSVNCSEPSK